MGWSSSGIGIALITSTMGCSELIFFQRIAKAKLDNNREVTAKCTSVARFSAASVSFVLYSKYCTTWCQTSWVKCINEEWEVEKRACSRQWTFERRDGRWAQLVDYVAYSRNKISSTLGFTHKVPALYLSTTRKVKTPPIEISRIRLTWVLLEMSPDITRLGCIKVNLSRKSGRITHRCYSGYLRPFPTRFLLRLFDKIYLHLRLL